MPTRRPPAPERARARPSLTGAALPDDALPRAPAHMPFVADGVTCLDAAPLAPGEPYLLPLIGPTVPCGFPSPAEDFAAPLADLRTFIGGQPGATFILTVAGDSMVKAGILHGDRLVVDRSLEAREGDVVVAAVNGEMTVKRLRRVGGRRCLVPESDDPRYAAIPLTGEGEFFLWGVVVASITVHRP